MASAHPMDIADAEDREANMLDFECTECKKTFHVDSDCYRGQWDHGDTHAICPACEERLEAEEAQERKSRWARIVSDTCQNKRERDMRDAYIRWLRGDFQQ